MAEEEKKSTFPWVQLIATIGTVVAALIGITPYILKLNTPSSSTQTPTIVFVTLPPVVVTPTPAATTLPVTPAETTPGIPQTTTAAATTATTGPPPTGTGTPVPTTVEPTAEPTTVPTTVPVTEPTLPVTETTTLPPGPAIQITVDTPSITQGGTILANVSTDAGVPLVTITLRNSTTFESQPITQALVQGMVTLSLDTSPYAPGDYTISAAVPDTTSVASTSFVITPP